MFRYSGASTALRSGALVAAGAALTRRRNFDWADDAALFTAAEDVCPDSAKVRRRERVVSFRI